MAYQLWAYVCDRDVKRVRAELLSGDHGEPADVPDRTLRHWIGSGDWAARAHNELRAIAPDIGETINQSIVFASLAGARYIRRVAEGLEDTPDVSDLGAADWSMYEKPAQAMQAAIQARVKAHALARRDRIQAASTAIDRYGITHQTPVAGDRSGGRTAVPSGRLSESDRQAIAERLASMAAGKRDSGEGNGA